MIQQKKFVWSEDLIKWLNENPKIKIISIYHDGKNHIVIYRCAPL